MDDTDNISAIFSHRLTLLVDARGYPKTNYGRNTMLAFEWGVSAPYVYKLFHGNIASPLLLRDLAIKLGTTTDYLLGLSDEMDSPAYKAKNPTLPE